MAGIRTEARRRLDATGDVEPRPDQIVTALNHPLRRRILRCLHDAGEARSPRELAALLDRDLGEVARHVAILEGADMLALTDTICERGANEYFYASTLEADGGFLPRAHRQPATRRGPVRTATPMLRRRLDEPGQQTALDPALTASYEEPRIRSEILAYVIDEGHHDETILSLARRFSPSADSDAVERAVRDLVGEKLLRIDRGRVVPGEASLTTLAGP